MNQRTRELAKRDGVLLPFQFLPLRRISEPSSRDACELACPADLIDLKDILVVECEVNPPSHVSSSSITSNVLTRCSRSIRLATSRRDNDPLLAPLRLCASAPLRHGTGEALLAAGLRI